VHKKSPSITNVILRTNKIRVTTRIQTVSALIASYHSHVYDNGDLRQGFSVKDFLPCCSRTGSDCILLRPCTNRPFSDSYKVLLFPFIAFEYILSQSSCLVHKKSVNIKAAEICGLRYLILCIRCRGCFRQFNLHCTFPYCYQGKLAVLLFKNIVNIF